MISGTPVVAGVAIVALGATNNNGTGPVTNLTLTLGALPASFTWTAGTLNSDPHPSTLTVAGGSADIDPDGATLFTNDTITLRLDRRAYTPVLRQADLPDTPVPWWGGRTLRYEFT